MIVLVSKNGYNSYIVWIEGNDKMLAPGDVAIDVICQFTRDGNIIPMKIRMQDDDGELQEYRIKAYKEVEVLSGVASGGDAAFECKIEAYGRVRNIKILYSAFSRQWAYRPERRR